MVRIFSHQRLVVLLALSALGCSSGSGGGGAPVPIDVVGQWDGTWTSTANPGNAGALALDLGKLGADVIGQANFGNSPCISQASAGSVFAHYDDLTRQITGSIHFAGGTSIQFDGSVSADSRRITAAYSVSQGGCAGDGGSVTITKSQPIVVGNAVTLLLLDGQRVVEELRIVDERRSSRVPHQ